MTNSYRSPLGGGSQRKKVLFICTHNSARSQMAEGILRHQYGKRYEAFSAGTEPSAVDPLAVRVLLEIGIDISQSRPKSVNEFSGREIDYVVTLCNDAKERCPFFPGAKEYIHRGFEDPADVVDPDNRLSSFRHVRDELREWIIKTFGNGRNSGIHSQLSFDLQSNQIAR